MILYLIEGHKDSSIVYARFELGLGWVWTSIRSTATRGSYSMMKNDLEWLSSDLDLTYMDNVHIVPMGGPFAELVELVKEAEKT